MKFKDRFNEILKNEKRMGGKTQVDIANAIHVKKQCVSDYKSGKSVPSVETLYLLCKYLDVSADWILGLDEDNKKQP